MRKMILVALTLLLAAPLYAELTQERVDSMFLIASSGAMKYRDLVEPTTADMAAYGTEIVPYLITKLGTIDARERVTLENIFKKIGQPAVPYLIDAIPGEDSLQLSRICLILYYLPDTSAVEKLLTVKDNDFYWVRYEVIRALGKIGDFRATDAVREALADKNELVRTMAAVAAGRLNNPALNDDLVTALDDPYYGVRMSAREALLSVDCEYKKQTFREVLKGQPTMIKTNLLLSVIAEDDCDYQLGYVWPYLMRDEYHHYAWKAGMKIDSAFVINTLTKATLDSSDIRLQDSLMRFLNE